MTTVFEVDLPVAFGIQMIERWGKGATIVQYGGVESGDRPSEHSIRYADRAIDGIDCAT